MELHILSEMSFWHVFCSILKSYKSFVNDAIPNLVLFQNIIIMDFIDLASSFVISLIAGLGNSAIDRVVDNKSLEKRIKICFHKAVEQWDVSKDVKDSVKIKELEHFLELEKYLKNPAKGIHPKLGELLRL